MGGVVKKAKRLIRKAIPKEVRPALPFAAAYFGPQFLTGPAAAFAKANPNITRALIASGTSAAQGDDTKSVLRSGVLAAAPGVLSDQLQQASIKSELAKGFNPVSSALDTAAGVIRGASPLQTIGTQAAIEGSAQLAEIQQDQIDAYNRQLQEQGVMNKVKRRQGIYDIYINAGYDPDYVNSVLDKYGYADGGIAYLADGGYLEEIKEFMKRFKAPETVAQAMSKKGRLRGDKKDITMPKRKPKQEQASEEEDDEGPVPVTTESDLASGLAAAAQGVERAFGRGFGNVEPVPMLRFAKGGRAINYESYKDFIEQTGDDELMDLYIEFLGTGDFTKLGNALKRKGFARGGEVEIEEETEDLGIMDFMKDQGVPYGEMASDINNERILEQLYEEFLDMGLSPADAAKAAREAFDRMSSKPREGIMQMASGYKTDIEEMYEQYVFEMEEMGLEPMSFSQFVAREKAGMADGGKVKRRKKGQEDDSDGKKPGPRKFPKFEDKRLFEEKMPQVMPNKPDMMEAAMGGIASMADGGIMEKDMRGGGFIPEGSKEKADDVPARLSKNEFVMTADAVRAAGGGSINKGAKRMYDMMYSLEGKI